MLKKIVTVLGMSSLLISTSALADENSSVNKDSASPQSLNLAPLRNLNTIDSPMGADYSYCEAFKELDVEALKKDMTNLLTQSQDWWPADFDHTLQFGTH